jgi:hypothetical protein
MRVEVAAETSTSDTTIGGGGATAGEPSPQAMSNAAAKDIAPRTAPVRPRARMGFGTTAVDGVICSHVTRDTS